MLNQLKKLSTILHIRVVTNATLNPFVKPMLLMIHSTYSINSREYTLYSPLLDELHLQTNKNYLFDLSYLGVFDLSGENASDFLQGQITCDVRQVNHRFMRQGALCNLKGRILALMDVIQFHNLHLVLPADLLNATQHTLSKTAVFSKVIIQPSTAYTLFGFYLQDSQKSHLLGLELPKEPLGVSQNESCIYHLVNNIYILMIPTRDADTLRQQYQEKSQWKGSLAWHALTLHHKKIEIYPESRGLFLPHRLDLQLSSLISFDKGCYKGQEIIARTHYRAKRKHQLKLFQIHSSDLLHSGSKLFAPHADIEIGELIDFCPLGNGHFIIATSINNDHPLEVRIGTHWTLDNSRIALTCPRPSNSGLWPFLRSDVGYL